MRRAKWTAGRLGWALTALAVSTLYGLPCVLLLGWPLWVAPLVGWGACELMN